MHASYSKCSCNCFLFIAIFVRLHDCNMRNLSLWDLWIISFRSEGRTSWWNLFIQLSALQRLFSVTSSKSSKTSKFWPLDFSLVANVRYSTPICKHILPPNALDCFKVSAILSLVPIWEEDAALQYNYPAAKGNLPLTWSWTDGARPHSGLIKVEWWISRRRTETRRSKRGNEEIAG